MTQTLKKIIGTDESIPEEEEAEILYELLDLRNTPPGGFKFKDPDTGYTTQSPNAPALFTAAADHRRANGLELPRRFPLIIQDQICRGMREEAACKYCQEAVIYLDDDEPSRGLGDTVARVLNKTGINKLYKKLSNRTRTNSMAKAQYNTEKAKTKPCGCGGRQRRLNKRFSK